MSTARRGVLVVMVISLVLVEADLKACVLQ
jgi:hypothetical protein